MFWASWVELCALRAVPSERYPFNRTTSCCFAFRLAIFGATELSKSGSARERERRKINLKAFDIVDDKKHRKAIFDGS